MRFKKYSRLKTCRRNISGGGGGREGRVGLLREGVRSSGWFLPLKRARRVL